MSKIRIFSLGGLNENGKNMYVTEVDEDIFVFEAGLKYADENMLGIDYIIPNFDYLIENRKRIKGIFLTHGHDENVGSIPDIVKEIPEINVYGAKFTIDIVKKELEESEIKFNNLVEIQPYKTLEFGENKIFPIRMSHSIPDNLGYALYTNDGVIFYASDFVFDPTLKGSYQTDVGKLAYIGKQGVLCLMAESMYAEKQGFTSPNHRINALIKETLNNTEGRIIFNVLASHLYRIQELFNEVSKTNRKIVIMGKKLQNIIASALVDKQLLLKKDIIGDLSNLNDSDSIILVSNEREKPYSGARRIAGGYDKFINLKDTDTFFMAIPLYEGMEKTYFEIADEIAKKGVDLVMLSKNNLRHHASSEDLMMLINLMKPKYYFPIKGEYRYQMANADLASSLGIPSDHILLKQNGDVVTFENGKLVDNFDKVNFGTITIDGKNSEDVGELVIKDREMLSADGIVIVSTTIDKKTKKILAGPEVLSRGFIYMKDSEELINEIKTISKKVIEDNTTNNYLEFNKIKNGIREELGKFLFKETGCRPMIISVIQEIE